MRVKKSKKKSHGNEIKTQGFLKMFDQTSYIATCKLVNLLALAHIRIGMEKKIDSLKALGSQLAVTKFLYIVG